MWTNRQKGIVKTYQRYAGLADPEYRALLHEQTGATSSRDAHLTQYHFDAFMPRLEIRAHLAETNGLAVGRKPAKLSNWYYWRDRSPERGKASRPGPVLIDIAKNAQVQKINYAGYTK